MKRIKEMKLLFVLAALFLGAALVAGCGSATKESGDGPVIVPTTQAATVGMNVCTQCHTEKIGQWVLSRHGNTDASASGAPSGNLNSIGSPSYPPSSPCIPCHDPLGDSLRLVSGVTGNMPRNVIGCESCHGGGGQHYGVGPISMTRLQANTIGSGQFNTCNDCHQLLDSAGAVVTAPFHSQTERRIIDTHYDDPATAVLEGYNVSRMSETACSNCHEPHAASLTVNLQWRQSGHGDLSADPWSHYDWKAANRQSCQRCHTATGAANYLTSPSTYNAANNDFSHLAGSQLEVLYCNACHVNPAGGLRNPGAITASYTGASVTYPNAYKSNLCLACHTGRESGGSIVASTGTFTNLTFINSHYLTAGGTVYTETGYEFTGKTYTNATLYHDDVGGTSTPIAGTRQGPCVGCHMSTSERHLFMPVTETAGVITAITSTICIECHGVGATPAMSVGTLNTLKGRLADALDALDVQLQQRGIHFFEAYPYFFTAAYNTGYTETGACTDNLAVKNWQTGGTSSFAWNGTTCVSTANNAGTADTGKNNMGAAFNLNLLKHDPGAFAHNSRYSKRLIYDSIDWLDDNVLNDSVSVTLNAAPHSGQAYQAGAITYLIPRP